MIITFIITTIFSYFTIYVLSSFSLFLIYSYLSHIFSRGGGGNRAPTRRTNTTTNKNPNNLSRYPLSFRNTTGIFTSYPLTQDKEPPPHRYCHLTVKTLSLYFDPTTFPETHCCYHPKEKKPHSLLLRYTRPSREQFFFYMFHNILYFPQRYPQWAQTRTKRLQTKLT